MNNLKKLPMALTILGLGAASSFAELKVNDNLGVSGFIDMSAVGEANDSTATFGASLDQLELDFMFKFGDKISARADINALPSSTTTTTPLSVDVEQAFITYSSGGAGVNVGRFLSSSGFEAAEPTGLYQFSVSKNLNGPAGAVYGSYQNGISASYATPKFGLYGAVVSDLWLPSETDYLTPGFEGQVSVMPVEGLTAKVAYLYQMYDDTTGDASQQLLNAWTSFARGPLTLAAEYNLLIDWTAPSVLGNEESGNGWLAMANYKFTDKLAATLRYSGMAYADLDPDTEVTFSPSLTISPNWLALAEVKYQIDASVTNYAVESLFSF